jgi:hypothetical protein
MMAWLLWARFLVLALLVGLVASFVWMQLSRDDEG